MTALGGEPVAAGLWETPDDTVIPEQAKETMKTLKGIKIETEAPVNVTVK